jgi:hypothetical protein
VNDKVARENFLPSLVLLTLTNSTSQLRMMVLPFDLIFFLMIFFTAKQSGHHCGFTTKSTMGETNRVYRTIKEEIIDNPFDSLLL